MLKFLFVWWLNPKNLPGCHVSGRCSGGLYPINGCCTSGAPNLRISCEKDVQLVPLPCKKVFSEEKMVNLEQVAFSKNVEVDFQGLSIPDLWDD